MFLYHDDFLNKILQAICPHFFCGGSLITPAAASQIFNSRKLW